MSRQGFESRGTMYDTVNDTNSFDGTDFDGNAVSRSMNSRSSYYSAGNASASSSKAVLAALRALQDKIRRLESERAQALDETVQLRHQMKNQLIESDNLKHRENLAAQKILHESRCACERLLTEKTEMELRLAKLDDRSRDEQQNTTDLRSKMASLENDRRASMLEIDNLEVERSQLGGQLLHAQQKEKELGEALLWESRRREEEVGVLSTKLRSLQDGLNSAVHEKGIIERKLFELDELVSQLLSVNESLVIRLSGTPVTKTAAPKCAAIKKKKAIVPKAKDISQNVQSNQPTSFDEVKNLHGMHKMYVKLANNLTDNRNIGSAAKVLRKDASPGKSNVNEVKSTLIRGRSLVPKEDRIDYGSRKYDVQIPNVPSESRSMLLADDSMDNTGNYTESDRTDGGYKNFLDEEIETVIVSLEEELSTLNDQYHSLISSSLVQTPSQSSSQQAGDLMVVIQKLHKKREQIKALRSPSLIKFR